MSDTVGFNLPPSPYTSAGTGRRLKNWRPGLTGPNSATLGGLGLIRQRSRHAARNDPWAGTALDKLTSNGIGTGIQAKGQWGTDAFKKARKRLWRRWGKECDADGVLVFEAMQALVWRSWHEGGECFVRLRRRRLSDGLAVPLQLQIIEAEQCPAEYYSTASNGNQIRAGVEFNAIGQRVAYWMYKVHPGDVFMGNVDAGQLTRVPAEEVLHIFEPLRPGQIRGIPRAASVLVRMFNLDNFDDAVLERQKIANLFASFVIPPEDKDENLKLRSSPNEELADEVQADPGAMIGGLEPGTTQELPPGWKVEFSDPPDAGSNYGDYMRSHLQAIAARHGVPYELLTGDLRNISDRALRLVLNEFRRVIEMWQWLFLIPQFCQPVMEVFMDAAVLSGALVVDGYADPELREDVVETLWVTQGWPYSHPVQDVNADKIAVLSGFKTRSGTILANGDDPEEIDAEMAEDQARADRLGLTLATDGRVRQPVVAAGNDAPSNPPPDDNDGED